MHFVAIDRSVSSIPPPTAICPDTCCVPDTSGGVDVRPIGHLWRSRWIVAIAMVVASITIAIPAVAAPATAAAQPVYVFGIPVDFILFGLTLAGVALFHHRTLQVALTGLAAVVLYKLFFTGFKFGPGPAGLALHLQHEWVILANLFLLLMGFAILSRHFENSRIPDEMPAFLPDG
jgi:hypothetical protein